MPLDDLLAVFDREQRRDVTYPDARREAAPGVVRLIGLDRRECYINYSELSAADADTVIGREVAHAAGRGCKLVWKVYGHDRPADLKARLASHGFTAKQLEAVLVLDMRPPGTAPAALARLLAAAPEEPSHAQAGSHPQAGAGPRHVEIRRITGLADIGDVIVVEQAVWGEDQAWLVDLGRELEREPEGLSMYCAYVDGVPASAAWARFHTGTQFVSLWGGSTAPAYRRLGLYTALLSARAREGFERNFRYLTVDAGAMSRPILEKHGFKVITTAQDYEWTKW